MYLNLNNPPHDKRNPKTRPITIESYQKEHLFIPKICPTRGGSSASPRGSTRAEQILPRPKQTTKHRQTKTPLKKGDGTHQPNKD